MGLPAQRRLWLAVATLLAQHTYSQFEARTSIFVDDTEVEIVANADRDDFAAVGRDVCAKMGVDLGATLRDGRMRCGALIADELADSLYCNATARGASTPRPRVPRAFRFYHGEFYFDSEEYELLRELLLRQRYVECLSGERLRGGEDVIWLLGHFDGDAWFYKAPSRARRRTLPQPTELGNKDSLYRHLLALRAKVGDRATRFLPRTWLPDDAKASRNGAADELGGLWLRKDPAQELGFGITLITKWSELEGCEHCLLQRYVAAVSTDGRAGVLDAKFSFGVYVTVSSVDPLESGDLLSHLTNGLLNQRLAGDDFDAAERVWTTDRLLAHLDKRGVSWASIEDQALNGVGGAPSPDRAHYPGCAAPAGPTRSRRASRRTRSARRRTRPTTSSATGAESAEAAVRARLGAAGDVLVHDDAAVAAIAAYEARGRRRGGYRPLLPVPRTFDYFDGSVGANGDDLPDLFRRHGALPLDAALDRWASLSGVDDEPVSDWAAASEAAAAARARANVARLLRDGERPHLHGAAGFRRFSRGLRDKRDVAASLPYGLDTSLYLLLTDRRRVDGAAAGTLADPNVLDDLSPLQGLLDKAVAATAPLVDAAPLPRRTSLRYGAGYAYPTHVDCYENVIFQLAGRKNVTIFPPDVVWDTKPDVENKHWPRGGDDDLRRARRSAVSVELGPGDALYVPLMWPHNVDSDEFSVTANAYLRLGTTPTGATTSTGARPPRLAYEIATGTRLC
ncbi:hypothetical protein JL720_16866 [Aureococcus anophagefferens]|nr:hypothetical protein JL720_16866 [Aureococcus anophagefferens]